MVVVAPLRLIGSAVAVLLVGEALRGAPPGALAAFVCGANYDDASLNCTINPPCPIGDECPPDQSICYTLTEETCFSPPMAEPSSSPTVAPTASPTPPALRICGASYDDALAGCRTLPRCPGGDVRFCPPQTACFTVQEEECPTDAPTASPTPRPKVCGSDSFDAQAKCLDPTKHCPSGDGCPIGEACFNIPPDVCGVTQTPTAGPTVVASLAVGGDLVDSVASLPEQDFIKVCGTDSNEAQVNCRTNPLCPTGDISECPSNHTCFAFTPSSCPTLAPNMPPGTAPLIVATPKPIVTPLPTGPFVLTPNPSPSPTTTEPAGSPVFDITPLPTDPNQLPGQPDDIVDVQPTDLTPPPTASSTSWMDVLFGPGGSPSPTDTSSYQNFCGWNEVDAATNCAENVACPDGLSDNCPDGQTCFPIPNPCDTGGFGSTDPNQMFDQPIEIADSQTTGSSLDPTFSLSVPVPVVFDPTAGKFCGDNFYDARENCYQRVHCPTGLQDECPGGQGCFPVDQCIAPDIAEGNVGTTEPPTKKPTSQPSPNRQFDLLPAEGSNSLGRRTDIGGLWHWISCGFIVLGPLVL